MYVCVCVSSDAFHNERNVFKVNVSYLSKKTVYIVKLQMEGQLKCFVIYSTIQIYCYFDIQLL